ncbi:hypothetical protein KX928_09580 [Roseobacter sp. YSTF-M11]|uniref:Uncharacterized protein n=1 Tax=Roseobacter insulae TaxID=2859783 RepID=A0A9X1FUS5_9RHOB|nr:hypothetical protein [Roseobacter insulae]MBW4708037.1 hypothetical protein [Roseobacter insulae]
MRTHAPPGPTPAPAPTGQQARLVASAAGLATLQQQADDSQVVARLAVLQRKADRKASAPAPSDPPIQREKNIGLGFTDLENDRYGEDAFGKSASSKGNLSKFRTELDAEGPGAFVKGLASQRQGGQIQGIFTGGIKKAMEQSLTIKQNLAGFTQEQIDHARNHPPMLSEEETLAAQAAVPIYASMPGTSAELWSAMSDVAGPLGFSKGNAAISVWELSHMLHNQTLFAKTEFYDYNASDDVPNTVPLTPEQLEAKGIELSEDDQKTLAELGIEAPQGRSGGNWFTNLFKCCFGG